MRRHPPEPAPQYDPLALAAATWLACGVVLFGLTPLPWRDATLGWSPAFWLLGAPCLLLAARRVFLPRARETPRQAARSPQRDNAQAFRRRRAGGRPGGRARRAA